MHAHLWTLWLTLLQGADALPPDYYEPRNPTVTFPRTPIAVAFPAAVAPTVRFTP